AARAAADAIADEDVAINRALGAHALPLIRAAGARRRAREPIQLLTHCNAGWLATVDQGTALAGVYAAHDAGIPVHVWVDETRPRNQGAALTAWELGAHGVPHTVIVDNAGGHLMQRGDVDVVLVGTDRTTAAGDVVNKIGTYLKALAARDCGVPFYVAAPSPSIDWTIDGAGAANIPIEERSPEEVTTVAGTTAAGDGARLLITPTGVPCDEIDAVSIARLPLGGDADAARGPFAPSTEWRIHRDIYRQRPDVGAVVHTHSTFATALACLRRAIPAFHYMVAKAGAGDIRCARYATYGTAALSRNALAALGGGRRACLLANHGLLA